MCVIRPIHFGWDSADLKSFLTEKDAARLDQCRPAVAAGDAFILVAVHDGKAVGWAAVHTRCRDDMGWGDEGGTISFQQGENAYLENIAVMERLRNRGIGSQLLCAAEDGVRQRRKHHLWLHTGEKNCGAHRFYERHGWSHERTVYPSWTQGAPTRVYCKAIR